MHRDNDTTLFQTTRPRRRRVTRRSNMTPTRRRRRALERFSLRRRTHARTHATRDSARFYVLCRRVAFASRTPYIRMQIKATRFLTFDHTHAYANATTRRVTTTRIDASTRIDDTTRVDDATPHTSTDGRVATSHPPTRPRARDARRSRRTACRGARRVAVRNRGRRRPGSTVEARASIAMEAATNDSRWTTPRLTMMKDFVCTRRPRSRWT